MKYEAMISFNAASKICPKCGKSMVPWLKYCRDCVPTKAVKLTAKQRARNDASVWSRAVPKVILINRSKI